MIKVDNKKDLEAELAKSKRVLVLFYASWCPHCNRFLPSFNEKVSGKFESVIYALLDDYDNPLWDEFEIPAVPTIILFEEGKICNRLDASLGTGLNLDRFLTWLENI